MTDAIGYAAHHSFSNLKPLAFKRAAPTAHEIEIEVLFCGVCHSDIHQAKNEWSNTIYPCMPGHEVVGRVTHCGTDVTRHAVGDVIGVGCMVDSCRVCAPCLAGEQNYCQGPNGFLSTYNGPMIPAALACTGENMYGRDNTYGGYSNVLVVREDFAVKIPASLKPEVAAPILCAGVTTYSPMKHWGVKAGDRVGVIGFGGLGDMAIKIAKALGTEVTVFTHTPEKLSEATKLGVAGVLATDKSKFAELHGHFDFMISTIPQAHDINPYIQLLKRDCTIVIVGALETMERVNNAQVAFSRRSVAGSLIGSIAETQDVLDFCAEHGIAPDIRIIPIEDINKAFKQVIDDEVRFRFVIDMASLKSHIAGA